MTKNTAISIFIGFLVLLCVGIIIPKIIVSENPDIKITQEERIEIIEFISQHRDNPLQRLVTFKTVIDDQKGNTFYVGTYTFFGIKCEQVKITGGFARTVYNNQICRSSITIIAHMVAAISWIANKLNLKQANNHE